MASSAGRPASCTAVGRPSSPWKSGSEMAGWPEMLKMAVYGVNWPLLRKSSHGSSLHASIAPIGNRALGERGREDRVVLLPDRDDPARHRAQLRAREQVVERAPLADPVPHGPRERLDELLAGLAAGHEAAEEHAHRDRRAEREGEHLEEVAGPPRAPRSPRRRGRARRGAARLRSRRARTRGRAWPRSGRWCCSRSAAGRARAPPPARRAPAKVAPRSRRPPRSRSGCRGAPRSRRPCG